MTLSVVHAIRSDAFAGVERHVAALAAQQHADGLRVAVIGGDPVRMCAALGDAPIPLAPARTTLDVARALATFGGADIVHAHMTAAETATLIAPGARRVPLVVTRHFGGPRGASRPGRLAGVAIRRRVAAQIAISRYVADRVDGPSTVILPGVPTAPRVPAGRRRPFVLVAQRLEPEKGTDLALRAFAASGLAASGWELRVAGDGSQRGPLTALAADLGIAPHTDFLGMRSDVDRLQADAGVLIAPCEIEGLGLTVLEAMACGLPVVASAAGGHLETVGAVEGAQLFAPGDVGQAAALLAGLAADADRRDAYGGALHDAQRRLFTTTAQARATEAVYRSVS